MMRRNKLFGTKSQVLLNKDLKEDIVSEKDAFTNVSSERNNNIVSVSDDFKKTLYGFDRVESKGTVKMSISSDSKYFNGLPNGIYIVEKKLYYKDVTHTAEQTLFDDVSPFCGFLPVKKDNGEESISSKRSFLYTETGTCATMRTYLYYVKCTLSGQTVNKYFPCNPNDIRWDYILF